MPAWRGEVPWAADLLFLPQPVDLGCVVDRTEIKTRVTSVAADIKQETSVDYPSTSLPRHATANEPTTAWHWVECSGKNLLHVTSAWQQHEPLLWERLKTKCDKRTEDVMGKTVLFWD